MSIDSCVKAELSEKLPTVKGAKASINLKPDAKPMFRTTRKKSLPVEWTVKKTNCEILLLVIFEVVETGGVDKSSPVL